jgi:hypothetical protein
MSAWTVIAKFDTYEKAREYVEGLPQDTNDNSLKEFKIKLTGDKFTVRSRYDKSLENSVKSVEDSIKSIKRKSNKNKG